MSDEANVKKNQVMDEIELKEWLASLDYVLSNGSPERVQYLLQQLFVLPFALKVILQLLGRSFVSLVVEFVKNLLTDLFELVDVTMIVVFGDVHQRHVSHISV